MGNALPVCAAVSIIRNGRRTSADIEGTTEHRQWRTRCASVERKHLLVERNQLRGRRILCSRNRVRSAEWKLLQHVLLKCGARNGRRCYDRQRYPNPFAIEEKEQSVVDDRPAHTSPEMVDVRSRLVIAWRGVGKVIRRVQD